MSDVSEKIREAMDRRKRNSQPVNQKVPVGKVLVGTGQNKRFVFDPSQRPVIRLIKYYRNCGLSLSRISDKLEELLSKREGRDPVPAVHFKLKRAWTKRRVQHVCGRLEILMPDGPPSVRRMIWNRSEQ